jgi:hypothetical protein
MKIKITVSMEPVGRHFFILPLWKRESVTLEAEDAINLMKKIGEALKEFKEELEA